MLVKTNLDQSGNLNERNMDGPKVQLIKEINAVNCDVSVKNDDVIDEVDVVSAIDDRKDTIDTNNDKLCGENSDEDNTETMENINDETDEKNKRKLTKETSVIENKELSPVLRIDRAIKTLKNELSEMQKQDVCLLRQLMQIHASISILNGSRDPHRRSVSSSSLLPPESPSPMSGSHRPLRRECSEPIPRPPLQRSSTTEEPPVTEEDPDIDDGDPLCHSFNSFWEYHV